MAHISTLPGPASCRCSRAGTRFLNIAGRRVHGTVTYQRSNRRSLRVKSAPSDTSETEAPHPVVPADSHLVTPEDAQAAQDLSWFTLIQLTVILVILQIVMGYGVSPLIASLLHDYPNIAGGVAPLTSQLLLILGTRAVVRPALRKNNTENAKFFRYIARPSLFAAAFGTTLICLAGNVTIHNLLASPQQAETARDLASVLDPSNPITMLGTGLASAALSPWIEERIHRGVILQSLISKIGSPAAVIVSSGIYAGTHLNADGFVQLFFLGCVLGTGHVVTGRNLFLPTMTHSAYNMLIFLSLLIASTTRLA